jgi:cell division transport system permease protein
MFWMRETASNIRRNRLMSLLAISTAAIGLSILGTFYLLTNLTRATVQEETQKIDLVIFLQNDITPARRKQIFEASRIAQVKSVVFVSRDQALNAMKRDFPTIPVDDFQGRDNPLHDELRLKLHQPQDLFKVREYLGTIKGVVEARTPEADAVVRALLAFNRFLTIAGMIALGVLGLAILLIIHNAIRLTIVARRREIRIMELVGATHTFISVPFLWEGIIYGTLGAVVATFLLTAMHSGLIRVLEAARLPVPLAQGAVLQSCILLTLGAGALFGLLGSWFSLVRSNSKNATS